MSENEKSNEVAALQPSDAWKAIMVVFSTLAPVLLFSLSDFSQISHRHEVCFEETAKVVHSVLYFRKNLIENESAIKEDVEKLELALSELDLSCDELQKIAVQKIKHPGDDMILLAAGRLHAGFLSWKQVKNEIEFLRNIGAGLVVCAFLLTIVWLLTQLRDKRRWFSEMSGRLITLLGSLVKTVTSAPFKAAITAIWVIYLVLWIELHHTVNSMREDLKHRYLLQELAYPDGKYNWQFDSSGVRNYNEIRP